MPNRFNQSEYEEDRRERISDGLIHAEFNLLRNRNNSGSSGESPAVTDHGTDEAPEQPE